MNMQQNAKVAISRGRELNSESRFEIMINGYPFECGDVHMC